jgi:DNA helicase II / ATP-dependent DNA helicase PcrA
MIKSEKEERDYLENVKEKLNQALKDIDKRVSGYIKDLKEQKSYLYENKTGMDRLEKVAVRQSVSAAVHTGEVAIERKKRIQKLLQSPYFGRFDFLEAVTGQLFSFYIGIYAYFDDKARVNLIHDWRAPVSTLFYDYELGPAQYQTPEGLVEGNLQLKRQYRIRSGKMEYMLESSLNIHDDILQKELSKSSDDKMNHIVATIQRNQNAIIRNETSRELIIQGVAGSGKTSIALHRIAFLLYRFKEEISSKDILILSPNKVFADYISNVLPELGEENIPEMGMEQLAGKLLEGKFKFQTFFQEVTSLLDKKDEAHRERIGYKSTFQFINKLNEYLAHIENKYFKAETLRVGRYPVPATYIEDRFHSWHRLPIFARFNKIAEDIERDLLYYNSYELSGNERNVLRKSVKAMFQVTNLRALYKDFYEWLGRPGLLKMASGSTYENSDVFPLIYLKLKLEGISSYHKVKHLLVDEMQDYTPVQYAVLSRLFPCRKTILGDASQSVNSFSSSSSEEIVKVFPGAQVMKLNKSYRSTYEITSFAQTIIPDSDLEAMERHGEEPEVVVCRNREEEHKLVKKQIAVFKQSEHQSVGIVCKTQKQAIHWHHELLNEYPELVLLTEESAAFSAGLVICSVHMSKGLEFDEVIIPGADVVNYNEPNDKNLLYIACTRAMHRLYITCIKEVSPFIGRNSIIQGAKTF